MIKRIVLIKLNADAAHEAGRAALVARAREVLPTIPGVTGADAGVPVDEASLTAWDVYLEVRFARIEDVGPYRVHPIHTAFLEDDLNPVAEVKKAWNFSL